MRPKLGQILGLTIAFFGLAYLVLPSTGAEAEESKREVYSPAGNPIPEIMDLNYVRGLALQVANFICKSIEMPPLTGWDCGWRGKRDELIFAPEAWRVPSVLLMMRGVEWHINETDDTARGDEYCTALFNDLYAWRGFRVVEPIAQGNEMGHVRFEPILKAFVGNGGLPYGGRFVWGYSIGMRAFRWYQYPALDSGTVQLLTWEGYAAGRELDHLGNRLKGPRPTPVARGFAGALMDLEQAIANLTYRDGISGKSFDFYYQQFDHLYSAGEFVVLQRQDETLHVAIYLQGESGKKESNTPENRRALKIFSGAGSAINGFFNPGENPLQCSFIAPPGDTDALRPKPGYLKLQ